MSRTHSINVKVDEKEMRIIQEISSKAGLSKSAYLRSLALKEAENTKGGFNESI